MTATRPDTRPTRRRSRRWQAVAVAVVVVAALAAAGSWWFLRDDEPAAVTLDTATAALERATTTAAGGGTAATGSADTGTGTDPVDGGRAAPSPLSGNWSVDTSIGTFSFEDSTGSFVGFRVEEQLSGIGSTTAVGRTPEVSGSLSIEGTSVNAVQIEADMSAIVTNDRRRDDRARGALETDRFPAATFRLTEPIELGDAAASGAPVSVTATGELTVHGVTRTVQFPLEAQLSGDTIVVVGSLDIVFADYGVQVPSAPVVVSAEDHGPIELQLFFARS